MGILVFPLLLVHWTKQRKEVRSCYWKPHKMKFDQQHPLGMDFSLLEKLIPHPSDYRRTCPNLYYGHRDHHSEMAP